MTQEIKGEHFNDDDGNPTGGTTTGTGINILWQSGPPGYGDNRMEHTGAFVEGVIAAAIDRLRWYQDSKFNCYEIARAITHLERALTWLDERTTDREAHSVEGTHDI